MEKNSVSLAKFLKSKREAVGLSQEKVANLLGYSSAQFISNWERGVSSPPSKSLNKIVKIYKASSEELIQLIVKEKEQSLRKLLRTRKRH